MKTLLSFAVLASAMLTAGCTKDSIEPQQPNQQKKAILYASTEPQTQPATGLESRTTLNGAKILWSEQDQAHAVSAEDNAKTAIYTLKSGAGTTSASFEGDEIVGDKYFLYPASAFVGASKNTISFNLPSVQSYNAQSFGNGANPSIAQSVKTENLSFKNLCGVIKLQLTGSTTIRQITLSYPYGPVAGDATVAADFVDTPLAIFSDDKASTVTLADINVKLSDNPTPFYFVVPEGTYMPGLSFTITDDQGTSMTKTTRSDLNVPRSKISSLKSFEFNTFKFPDLTFRKMLHYDLGFAIVKNDNDLGDIDINDVKNQELFATISKLEMSMTSVESLQGIEYFTGLQTLNATDCPITTLDLSKNVSLQELQIARASLTQLELPSSLTKLAADNCQLTTLDISHTKLATDDIPSNMTVGAQTDKNGQSQTLELTVNPEQAIAWQKYLDANPVLNANVVIYNAPKFPDAKFRLALQKLGFALTADGRDIDIEDKNTNQLLMTTTELDLSNAGISSLKGLELFSSLYTLNCQGNTLTSLPSGLSTLEVLDCSGNQLTTLELPNYIRDLKCYNNQLRALDISPLKAGTGIDFPIEVGEQKDAAGTAVTLDLSVSSYQFDMIEKVFSGAQYHNQNINCTVVR